MSSATKDDHSFSDVKSTVLNILTAIFVIAVVLDPQNSIFHLKELSLGALLLFSMAAYGKRAGRFYVIPLLFLLVVVFSICCGVTAAEKMDIGYCTFIIRGALMLTLFLWIDRYHILDAITFPLMILSVISSILIWGLLSFQLDPSLPGYLKDAGLLYMYGTREFIGVEVLAVFFRTTPLFVFPFSIYTYKLFFERGKIVRTMIIWFLCFVPLFVAGTRACLLSMLCILAFFLLSRIRSVLGKSSYILFFIAAILLLFLLKAILMQGDNSAMIKGNHLLSYIYLFCQNPRVLVLGQGIGSSFYSFGTHENVHLTELSYMELLRTFGIAGTLIVLFIYTYPLFLLHRERNRRKYAIPVLIAYFLYLFIAGTNPLLLGSTGYLAMLAAYSYAVNPDYASPVGPRRLCRS